MGGFVGATFGVISLVLIFGIFVGGVWLLVKLLTWLGTNLKGAFADPIPTLIAALVAFLVVPDAFAYFLSVARSLLFFIPDAIVALVNDAGMPAACADNCASEVVHRFLLMLSDLLVRLGETLHVDEVPGRSLIAFLLIALGLYLVYAWLRSLSVAHSAAAPGAGPGPVVLHLAFFALVMSAFYLSLAALLAISLQSQTNGFAPEDLDKTIAADLPSREAFDRRYPALNPKIVVPDSFDSDQRALATRFVDDANTLAELASSARESSFNEFAVIKGIGLAEFRNQNAQRAGGRETIEHFGIVLKWYQSERRGLELNLNTCISGTTSVIRRAKSAVESFGSSLRSFKRSDPFPADLAAIEGSFDNVSSVCENSAVPSHNRIDPRPAHGFDLGFIGRSTHWLLGTESLPLAIIIGLVGFSILGATMSRIVRIGLDKGLAGVAVTDLLVVVAAGAAAALVVFLASYGGLAVISDTKTDPNPYVVFAACFIGAVFSEDVWEWARQSILGDVIIRPKPDAAGTPTGAGEAGTSDGTASGGAPQPG